MKNNVARAHIFLCIAAVIYSVYNVVLELSFRDEKKLSATGLSFFREVAAVPCLYVLAYWREGSPRLKHRNHIWLFMILAFVLGSFQLCFVIGVSLTDAKTAALFQCIEPTTAAVLATVVGAEVCSIKKFIAAILAGGGVAILEISKNSASNHHFAYSYFVGCALLFCQGFGIATYCLIQKRLVDPPAHAFLRYGPCTVTAHAYLGSLLIMILAAMVSSLANFEHPAPFSQAGLHAVAQPRALLVIAYAALFSSVIGYTLRAAANIVVDASILVLYNALQPPITALLSFLFFSDPYGPSQAAATALIITAVLLSAQERRSYPSSLLRHPTTSSNHTSHPIANDENFHMVDDAQCLTTPLPADNNDDITNRLLLRSNSKEDSFCR